MGVALTRQLSSPVRIGSVGTAVPDFSIDQQEVGRLVDMYYENELSPRSFDVLKKVLAHPSIRKRHLSVAGPEELLSLKNEDPDVRMERFTKWSVDLAVGAATRAMENAGVGPRDVRVLVVNTCTGYLCPGIGTYLVQRLGLSNSTKVHDLVGSGCAGAVPNLQAAGDMIAAEDEGVALSVSVEICTATYQMGNDISLIVSNAIFGDGAAAAVVWKESNGLEFLDGKRLFAPEYRDDIRYTYKGGQLHNRLTPQLPKIVGELIPPFVGGLLSQNSLGKNDISHWLIHSGGAKILDNIQEGLGLSDADMDLSRSTLSQFGNMSSPTVLFELEEAVARGIGSDEYLLMVAFGAGMAVHGLLLQNSG